MPNPEGQWIEIPSHRVWAVCAIVVRREYDLIGEDGEPCRPGARYVLVQRHADGKLFKPVRQHGEIAYLGAHGIDYLIFEEA